MSPVGGGGFGGSAAAALAGASGAAGNPCDLAAFYDAIVRGAGVFAQCSYPDSDPAGDAAYPVHGTIVIDDNGRVIDNTFLTGTAKQEWLDGLANERWVCLAGQSIGYHCEGHGG
jgi:hypothetical protein